MILGIICRIQGKLPNAVHNISTSSLSLTLKARIFGHCQRKYWGWRGLSVVPSRQNREAKGQRDWLMLTRISTCKESDYTKKGSNCFPKSFLTKIEIMQTAVWWLTVKRLRARQLKARTAPIWVSTHHTHMWGVWCEKKGWELRWRGDHKGPAETLPE